MPTRLRRINEQISAPSLHNKYARLSSSVIEFPVLKTAGDVSDLESEASPSRLRQVASQNVGRSRAVFPNSSRRGGNASNNLISRSVSDRLKPRSRSRYRPNRSVYFSHSNGGGLPGAISPLDGDGVVLHTRTGPGSVPESINRRHGSSLLKTTASP